MSIKCLWASPHCGITGNKAADREPNTAFQDPIAEIQIPKKDYKEEVTPEGDNMF